MADTPSVTSRLPSDRCCRCGVIGTQRLLVGFRDGASVAELPVEEWICMDCLAVPRQQGRLFGSGQ